MKRKSALAAALLFALLITVSVLPATQLAGAVAERLTNGDFEEGFYATPIGLVGNGWGWFDNGGLANYGFHADTWTPLVFSGRSSQLIEINTTTFAESNPDHYAGIYQTVAVVAGKPYDLTLHGMLRAREGDTDRTGYNYRVQIGVDYKGGADWRAVNNWLELPWDTVYPRLIPGALDSFSSQITASGDRLTLFVRVWYKWPSVGRELDVNLDAISLKGVLPPEPTPATSGTPSVVVVTSGQYTYTVVSGAPAQASVKVSLEAPPFPVVGWATSILVQSSNEVGVSRLELYDSGKLLGSVSYETGPLSLSYDFPWTPASPGQHTLRAVAYNTVGATSASEVNVQVGKDAQFLVNGSFEEGFQQTAIGLVGRGWGAFTNGGRAAFGFHDDTWPPVVADGRHSQLVEINTYDLGVSDPDRYAGIFQTVQGLVPGATYKLSFQSMLRTLANDTDAQSYGYRIQWGYVQSRSTDWRTVTNWVEIPGNSVYSRLDPGEMSVYIAKFQAPAREVTLFVRIWKKWGTVNRELDANLDAITLDGYQ